MGILVHYDVGNMIEKKLTYFLGLEKRQEIQNCRARLDLRVHCSLVFIIKRRDKLFQIGRNFFFHSYVIAFSF